MCQPVICVNESAFGKSYAAMMSVLENFDLLFNEFKAANANLSSAWQGKGGSSFDTVSHDMEAHFDKLKIGLERLSNEMQEAYDEFAALDDELCKAIGDLSLQGAFPVPTP